MANTNFPELNFPVQRLPSLKNCHHESEAWCWCCSKIPNSDLSSLLQCSLAHFIPCPCHFHFIRPICSVILTKKTCWTIRAFPHDYQNNVLILSCELFRNTNTISKKVLCNFVDFFSLTTKKKLSTSICAVQKQLSFEICFKKKKKHARVICMWHSSLPWFVCPCVFFFWMDPLDECKDPPHYCICNKTRPAT